MNYSVDKTCYVSDSNVEMALKLKVDTGNLFQDFFQNEMKVPRDNYHMILSTYEMPNFPISKLATENYHLKKKYQQTLIIKGRRHI